MLSCIVGKKSINTFEYKTEKLREWSNKGMLKCPECGERVIYCNGDYKIPYFRHEQNSDCKGSYQEPYTLEHINGIKIIYNWLKKVEGVKCLEVEKYIENTRQRPDIYFEYCNDRYCIELQCSPISTKYNDRRDLYRLEDIKDIWILGMNKYDILNYKNRLSGLVKNDKHLFEYKTKTIEREINDSEYPLMYLDVDNKVLYKVGKDGFEGVYRYEKFKGKLKLKTLFNIKLTSEFIKKCTVNSIILKDNLSKVEIKSMISRNTKILEDKIDYLNGISEVAQYKLDIENSNDRDPKIRISRTNYWQEVIVDDSIESVVNKIDEIVKKEEEHIDKVNKEYIAEKEFKEKLNEIENNKYIDDLVTELDLFVKIRNKKYKVYKRVWTGGALIVLGYTYFNLFDIDILEMSVDDIYKEMHKEINNYFNTIKSIEDLDEKITYINLISERLKTLNPIRNHHRKCGVNYLSNASEEAIEFPLSLGIDEIKFKITNKTIKIKNLTEETTYPYTTLEEFKDILINVISDLIRKARYS